MRKGGASTASVRDILGRMFASEDDRHWIKLNSQQQQLAEGSLSRRSFGYQLWHWQCQAFKGPNLPSRPLPITCSNATQNRAPMPAFRVREREKEIEKNVLRLGGSHIM